MEPRPVIYRALSRLEAARLVTPRDVESGSSPPCTGAGCRPLVTAQRVALGPVLAAIAAERDSAEGFEAVLMAWRHGNVEAAVRFLDEIR